MDDFIQKFIFFLVMYFASHHSLYAVESLHLSQQEFLKLALSHDPEALDIQNDVALIAVRQKAQEPSDHLRMEVDWNQGKSLTSSSVSTDSWLRLIQPFSRVGSNLVVSYTQSRDDFSDAQEAEIRYEQSLWKNRFGYQRALLSKRLEAESKLDYLNYQKSLADYRKRLYGLYIEFQRFYAQQKAFQKVLRRAEDLEKLVQKRQKQSVANLIDLAQVKTQVLQRKREQDEVGRQVELYLGIIRTLIKKSNIKIVPDPLPHHLTQVDEFEHLWKKWLAQSRDLEMLKLREKITELRYQHVEDEQNPQLAAVVGFNRQDATRLTKDSQRTDVIVGITLKAPLGVDTQLSAQRQQAHLEHEEVKVNREHVISQARRTLMQYVSRQRQLIDLNDNLKKEKILREKIVSEQKKRYQIGRIDLDRVMEAEVALAGVIVKLIDVQVEYLKNQTEFNEFIGND